MKKIRKINEKERDILLKERLRSPLSLGVLFYILGVLLPFFACMVITGDFKYLYLFMIGLIIFLMVVFVYPLIYYHHIQKGDISCFNSVVLSCKTGCFYYYLVEIEGLDDNYSPIKYPCLHRVKAGNEVCVVMMFGKRNTHRFILIDKNKNRLLSSKRTRFDLVD